MKSNLAKLFYLHTKRIKLSLCCCLLVCSIQSQGQADQRIVKADQYFAAGDYYTAAHLYEQFLTADPKQKTYAQFPLNAKQHKQGSGMGKGVSKTDIIYKQAESYRLANYWQQAAIGYKNAAAAEPVKYLSGLYWYAVCQRSLGEYDAATESLQEFLKTASADHPWKTAAEKELQRIAYIKSQISRRDTVLFHVQKLQFAAGNEKGIYAPVQTGNQLLITSTETDTLAKEGVSPYHNRLFTATLAGNLLENVQLLPVDASDATVNQGMATLNPTNGTIYFTQWKKQQGKSNAFIYSAKRTEKGLNNIQLLPLVNKEGFSSLQPFCTSDGKFLFFVSDRPGGAGKLDIWVAPILADGSTGEPMNAGPSINTEADEMAPFFHLTSNTLVFASNGRAGMGGYDLYMTKSTDKGWTVPENMGHPINSVRDDIYFTAPENSPLLSGALFSSDRGSSCCLETYTVSKTPKKKTVKGVVLDLKDRMPVEGATVVWKDSNGKTGTIITGKDGSYQFELEGGIDKQLFVTKELYKEKESGITVTETDESDLFTDHLTNTEILIEKKFVLKIENVVTVYFDFDMSNLKPAAINKLDSIYQVLVDIPSATIQISGYTDGRGSVEYNAVLSDKRARACADYLIAKGIDSKRISFESFGACCPVEMELINGRDNAEGRSKNRRALINVNKE